MFYSRWAGQQLWTDLHGVRKVVEDDHLQQQLLSAGDAGGEVQGQDPILPDRELQKNQKGLSRPRRGVSFVYSSGNHLHRRLRQPQAQILRHHEGADHPGGQAVRDSHPDVRGDGISAETEAFESLSSPKPRPSPPRRHPVRTSFHIHVSGRCSWRCSSFSVHSASEASSQASRPRRCSGTVKVASVMTARSHVCTDVTTQVKKKRLRPRAKARAEHRPPGRRSRDLPCGSWDERHVTTACETSPSEPEKPTVAIVGAGQQRHT